MSEDTLTAEAAPRDFECEVLRRNRAGDVELTANATRHIEELVDRRRNAWIEQNVLKWVLGGGVLVASLSFGMWQLAALAADKVANDRVGSVREVYGAVAREAAAAQVSATVAAARLDERSREAAVSIERLEAAESTAAKLKATLEGALADVSGRLKDEGLTAESIAALLRDDVLGSVNFEIRHVSLHEVYKNKPFNPHVAAGTLQAWTDEWAIRNKFRAGVNLFRQDAGDPSRLTILLVR